MTTRSHSSRLPTAALMFALACQGANAQWVTVDLSPFANDRIQTYWQPQSLSLPEGPVCLGGVPFDIQTAGGNNAWNAYQATGPHPRVLNVPIILAGATEVHTLINTLYGSAGPTSYIRLEFFGSMGAYHHKDFYGDVDVRDVLESGYTNDINTPTTLNVFNTGSAWHHVRLDKQQIVLPAAFSSQVLTSMRLTDTGYVNGNWVSIASIQGLTIGTGPRLPCGQTNSPCATLTVNGAGATGPGPFQVNVPIGGSLSFAWSGPAGQPLVLFGAASLAPGQSLGGSFLADLDFTSLVVLFSGLQPISGPLFFTSNTGGPYGVATQTFSVPPAAVGATLNVQGLVFDVADTCADGWELMSTASFAIQL